MPSSSTLVTDLEAAGTRPGTPLALVVVPSGIGLATRERQLSVPGDDAEQAALVADIDRALRPRWVWWSAARTTSSLVRHGARPGRCWDLAAVHRVLHGGRSDDPGRVWAAALGLPLGAVRAPVEPGRLDLWGAGAGGEGPLLADGHLHQDWLADGPGDQLDRAATWAALGLDVQQRQEAALLVLPDHRRSPVPPTLPLRTAFAESAAAQLAVELQEVGLPLDLATAGDLIHAAAGPRPRTPADEAAVRAARDAPVLALLPTAGGTDLRNPAAVGDALRTVGIDLPDTRAWRLEAYRGTHPVVEALLRWRKAERIATTYGYGWLDRNVGPDGRLRGEWEASDGAAGRMTAGAGLHNLPAELRVAVLAEPGHVLVRADLGQIEPRVLAAVSGDPGFAAAATADDLYAPVADQLQCDRPTAKVAVLAAMYGQTSGAAGQALRRMEQAFPVAIAYLQSAEESGRLGVDIRTYGGRLVRLHVDPAEASLLTPPQVAARGRYARNAAIQGAAAELFKAWAASVRSGLVGLDESSSGDGSARVVLCLHDELLLHVPEGVAPEVVDLVRSCLATTSAQWAAGTTVRFVADISVLRCWADAKG